MTRPSTRAPTARHAHSQATEMHVGGAGGRPPKSQRDHRVARGDGHTLYRARVQKGDRDTRVRAQVYTMTGSCPIREMAAARPSRSSKSPNL